VDVMVLQLSFIWCFSCRACLAKSW